MQTPRSKVKPQGGSQPILAQPHLLRSAAGLMQAASYAAPPPFVPTAAALAELLEAGDGIAVATALAALGAAAARHAKDRPMALPSLLLAALRRALGSGEAPWLCPSRNGRAFAWRGEMGPRAAWCGGQVLTRGGRQVGQSSWCAACARCWPRSSRRAARRISGGGSS